ncbi:MAG: Crp/Fnr family transcriptional regulator [Chitinophaga sp.]|uniref:Crp/Fnr family transcriptional regulator n=1 Tax=Chitinophaga sp. TaxID=1869181 RepID=UPI001B0F24FB|nr:Crp/Fnr family transcriptional regulator [Chitinophaga sp.]MBO9728701.1 Crp/Fnr family transcriptional regulator [Chitinophaga sp.]
MKAIVDFISRFTEVSEEDAEFLSGFLREKKFKANDIIFRGGNVCEAMYFVIAGTARSYFVNDQGQEYTWTFNFNDADATFENSIIIDHHSFINQTPSALTVEVIKDLDAVELRYKDFEIMMAASAKMHDIVKVFTDNGFSYTYQRAFNLFTRSAKDRYLQLLKDAPYLLNKFSHYHIASYLGIAPQSLSRLRREIMSGS